jgi:hypothetical protein
MMSWNKAPGTNRAQQNAAWIVVLFMVGWMVLFSPLQLWAQGFTTIFSDTGNLRFFAKGVGLINGSGAINLNVTGTPVRAFLYWQERDRNNNGVDNTITFNNGSGNMEILGSASNDGSEGGTNICFFAELDVALIVSGANSYTLSGLNNERNPGAALLVVAEDASFPLQEVHIKYGCDFFFHGTPGHETSETVSIPFAPESISRSATLTLSVGEAQVTMPRGFRGNDIMITTAAGSTTLSDQLVDSDGTSWDTFVTAVSIPANSTSAQVKIISPAARNGVSSILSLVAFAIPVTPLPPDVCPNAVDIGDIVRNGQARGELRYDCLIGNLTITISNVTKVIQLHNRDLVQQILATANDFGANGCVDFSGVNKRDATTKLQRALEHIGPVTLDLSFVAEMVNGKKPRVWSALGAMMFHLRSLKDPISLVETVVDPTLVDCNGTDVTNPLTAFAQSPTSGTKLDLKVGSISNVDANGTITAGELRFILGTRRFLLKGDIMVEFN